MTTDPVQEARDALIIPNDGRRPGFRADLAWFERTIRREEADRVLPVLRAVEWSGRVVTFGSAWIEVCPVCGDGSGQHFESCTLAAEITRLEALVGRTCHRCGGTGGGHNASTDPCDNPDGPCACGAWHHSGSKMKLCPECGGTGIEALVKEGE